MAGGKNGVYYPIEVKKQMATYLVDTENVGTAWLAVAEQMRPEDKMCVFAFSGDAKLSINFSMLETCMPGFRSD